MPDLSDAFTVRDERLKTSMDRSLAWFDRPASQRFFPIREIDVTHEHARQSVLAMGVLLEQAESAQQFAAAVRSRFDIYESIGRDEPGTVQFTAYYAPEYAASRERAGPYQHPLYRPPVELMPGNREHVVWQTRREIETADLLTGRELAWLSDPLGVYLIQVNGSAKLNLPDGGAMYVGHAGTNERAYTSLGRLMIERGLATADEMSMQTIREIHEREPELVKTLMLQNDRFVFFQALPVDAWPRSSLGIALSPMSSLATDKSVFPPGGVVLVEVNFDPDDSAARFPRFMLDQDSGGAIRSPGRADLYMGVGEEVGKTAGRFNHMGRLYYFFLKASGVGP